MAKRGTTYIPVTRETNVPIGVPVVHGGVRMIAGLVQDAPAHFAEVTGKPRRALVFTDDAKYRRWARYMKRSTRRTT